MKYVWVIEEKHNDGSIVSHPAYSEDVTLQEIVEAIARKHGQDIYQFGGLSGVTIVFSGDMLVKYIIRSTTLETKIGSL